MNKKDIEHFERVVERITKLSVSNADTIMKISKDEVEQKRLMLKQIRAMLDKLDSDYIVVVEGASTWHSTKDGIIRDLTQKLKEYEIKNGEDPDKEWI